VTDARALLRVPRITANDDQALLIGWAKAEGARVEAGETVCELEFSKSVVEVPAPCSGYLFHLHEAGTDVAVGAVIAIVSATAERPEPRPASPPPPSGVKITARARKLVEAHGIDLARFRGLEIVKERHVLAHLDRQAQARGEPAREGELKPLNPVRRRAALTLAESVRTIPHSYLTRWIPSEAVDTTVAGLARERQMALGLADWLVAAVAAGAAAHRKVNASWEGDGIFEHAHVNVGFALNQATGDLVVPVVHDADRLDLEALVGRIRGLQKKALRRRLAPGDLVGGTITVTSLLGSGVEQMLPILVPGQAAIVGLADRSEVHRAYALTVGFDHRVLNGAEAALFLGAVAAHLAGGRAG
jgi:pyruvate dehydrogenase E2 component (dihydrolipoamide acetyltransferase)